MDVRLIHKIVLDTEMMDYICVENEKDALTLSGSDPGVVQLPIRNIGPRFIRKIAFYLFAVGR